MSPQVPLQECGENRTALALNGYTHSDSQADISRKAPLQYKRYHQWSHFHITGSSGCLQCQHRSAVQNAGIRAWHSYTSILPRKSPRSNVKSAKATIPKANFDALLSASINHPSAKHIATVATETSWCRLWDIALEQGV